MIHNKYGKNLIFLVSQPRAGSTILQRLLGGHPEIHSVPEPWIMLHPLYGLKRQGFEADYNASWANSAVQDFYRALPLGEESYFEGLRRMYHYLYQSALEISEKSYFLDKTPRYYHVIPELSRTFPEAKFILLFRNPLAVFASILKTWVKADYVRLHEFKYDLINAPNLLLQGKKILENRSLSIVSYESLLAEPKRELEKICSQLELNFDSRILDCQPIEGKGFGYRDQSSQLLESGLVLQTLDKWILKLDNPQSWRIGEEYLEALGEQIIDSMGYSYGSLSEQLESIKPKKISSLATLPLKWFIMSEAERKASKKKYFLNRTIIKLNSVNEKMRLKLTGLNTNFS